MLKHTKGGLSKHGHHRKQRTFDAKMIANGNFATAPGSIYRCCDKCQTPTQFAEGSLWCPHCKVFLR